MSIENFCSQYPADPDIREIVGKKMTGRSDKSLVVLLAVNLAREGRDGGKKLIDKLNSSNTAFEMDIADFQRLPAEDRKNMFANFAAFVFGNSVLSLERALVNREYDHKDFCNRYNLEASSFHLSKVEVGIEEREELSYEKLSTMHSLVRQDKTFAIFFKEGIQAMPNILRRFLETGGIIPVIQEDILPIYESRAKFLVAAG